MAMKSKQKKKKKVINLYIKTVNKLWFYYVFYDLPFQYFVRTLEGHGK